MIRPKILVRAARIGASLYRRDRDLASAAPGLSGKPIDAALRQLIDTEQRFEEARKTKAPNYRPGQHVHILSAILAETAAQTSASGSSALRLAI